MNERSTLFNERIISEWSGGVDVYTACSNCSEIKNESDMIQTRNDCFCDEECMEDFQEGTI